MTHLGSRVSAYVDGQLPIGDAERLTAHLAGCRECRDAVERERAVKGTLSGLHEPRPDTGFLTALVDLGGPYGPVPPRPAPLPGAPRPPLVAFEADMRTPVALSLAPAGRAGAPMAWFTPGRRRWSGALIGAATVVGAGVISVAVLPIGGTSSTPLVRTPTGSLVVTPATVPSPGVRRTNGTGLGPSPTPPITTTSTVPTVVSFRPGARRIR